MYIYKYIMSISIYLSIYNPPDGFLVYFQVCDLGLAADSDSSQDRQGTCAYIYKYICIYLCIYIISIYIYIYIHKYKYKYIYIYIVNPMDLCSDLRSGGGPRQLSGQAGHLCLYIYIYICICICIYIHI